MFLMVSVFIRFYQLNIYRFSQLSNNSYKSGDSFSREAKKQGYRSRSAFKLLDSFGFPFRKASKDQNQD